MSTKSPPECRARPPRTRQKNRWKLKFHHQALPQEYLDHYERSLQKTAAPPPAPSPQPAPPKVTKPKPPKVEQEDVRAPVVMPPSKIVSYEDLPYMGEMTLNNSKPRRGRKPKKADICHLIYENYGTVVPGRPSPVAPVLPAAPARADLQQRLISSLLERKLSLERGRRDEPLNLCTRDRDARTCSVIQTVTAPAQPDLRTQLLYYQRLAESLSPPSPLPVVSPRTPDKRPSPEPPPPAPPTKRKRSAIFVPPVPARSSVPGAEVSICKFKFTGGSRPSLQEKKMLSVDAGGNFRYYSGAAGRGGRRGFTHEGGEPEPAPAPPAAAPPSPPPAPSPARRRSRKSLQREQLEQTFRERGFLIQTQSRQSAEGATYCKFRQLRKFTRYLFRSWRAHLPPELHEAPAQNTQPGPGQHTQHDPPAD